MNNWVLKEKDGLLTQLSFADDPLKMNWICAGHPWGATDSPEGIVCRSSRCVLPENILEETYTFTNMTAEPIGCTEGSIVIELPLNDNYLEAAVCLPHRCHVHVWCGGEVSWIMAVRMGGQAPHLGLLLTEGALGSYSIRRSLTESHCVSNTRGVFLLHPESFTLAPGESRKIRWQLFRHEGPEDFIRILRSRLGRLWIESEQWVAFQGENIHWTGGKLDTSRTGEVMQSYRDEGKATRAVWNVLPEKEELLRRRARFIAEHQQCNDPASPLDGAYLIYDNETGKQYYSHENPDHNSARERVGMGALMALYLQRYSDPAAEKSLEHYAAFILREIYDESTHTVYDDIGYSEKRHRLYNGPLVAVFFTELYRLKRDPIWIIRAADVMESYYREGGERFYAIGIPMKDIVELLIEAGQTKRAEEMRTLFVKHAQNIAAIGLSYPTHEVDYEQSIVAPAVNMLLMGYQLSGDIGLLEAGKEQLRLLTLFDGIQPDYHMNEVAIRHWDGYWFGKRRMLGDTLPHYWSSLTGQVFERYGRITGEKTWLDRAERNLRGSLSLFFPDGSASCAMVYPRSVNGETAHFYDPWANDQDWGLYYYFRRG